MGAEYEETMERDGIGGDLGVKVSYQIKRRHKGRQGRRWEARKWMCISPEFTAYMYEILKKMKRKWSTWLVGGMFIGDRDSVWDDTKVLS